MTNSENLEMAATIQQYDNTTTTTNELRIEMTTSSSKNQQDIWVPDNISSNGRFFPGFNNCEINFSQNYRRNCENLIISKKCSKISY